MKKRSIKKFREWKPKHKWIESIMINLKTGKKRYKYFTPKTPEEETKLETEFDEKMQRVLEIIFPNGIQKKKLKN